VEDIGRVNVLKTSEHLVHKVLAVIIGELILRVNDFVQVSFHEVQHYVDIFEILFRQRIDQITKSNYILVIAVMQKLDFSQNTLCVNQVVKCMTNLLNRNLLVGILIHCRTETIKRKDQ
jgi:hypothetical protein